MPTSDPRFLSVVSGEIIRLDPKSVLDVGIGLGKWGMLAREYTDAWRYRRYRKKEWQTKIFGIEIYSEYRNPVWDVYDNIYIGDALEVFPEVLTEHGPFDLVIMMDVIEHLTREQGKTMVTALMSGCSHLLLSYANMEQKNVCDNTHEDHISQWTVEDFTNDYTVAVLDRTIGDIQALILLTPKPKA